MNYASSDMPRRTAPVVVGIVLALVGLAVAQPALPVSKSGNGVGNDTKAKEDAAKLPKLTIGQCLQTAQENQPKLKALRASVGSAQSGQQGLEDARLLGQLSPEFKYRRQQAASGVCAAMAELEQAEHDVNQAVIWTYYSALYAREQVKVASAVVKTVDLYREDVEKIIKDKKGSKEFNQVTLNELIIRLSDGKRQLIKAQAGQQKAEAALREAMGVASDVRFELADTQLPEIGKFEVKREVVIGHAQTRRGEVIMAGLAVDVTQLETYVQWSNRLRLRVDTFASGADIHSRPLPSGQLNSEYRPGVLGPEMPARLVGSRSTRYQKASELLTRSEAVLEKTRNLVTLEAENAFIEYEASEATMAEAKIEVERANQNYMILRPADGQVSKAVDLRNVLEAHAALGKSQAALNEAVYHRITALASIERITAGGIKINYPQR
jgi:outer membrane protein TolC